MSVAQMMTIYLGVNMAQSHWKWCEEHPDHCLNTMDFKCLCFIRIMSYQPDF